MKSKTVSKSCAEKFEMCPSFPADKCKRFKRKLKPFLFSRMPESFTFKGMEGKQKRISRREIFCILTMGDQGISEANP